MRRRHLLVLAAAATATPAAADTARPRVNFAPTVSIGGPTEGSLYFNRDNPGIWASEADRHLPRIEIEPAPGSTTGLTVTTDHPMEGCRHYILKHKVLDWHFRLISQKTFDPAKDRPVSRHVLPAGYRGPIYAVSICNLHDAWIEGAMIEG